MDTSMSIKFKEIIINILESMCCIKVRKSCYISYIDYRSKNSELYITKI